MHANKVDIACNIRVRNSKHHETETDAEIKNQLSKKSFLRVDEL